jgi:hypothetical protein
MIVEEVGVNQPARIFTILLLGIGITTTAVPSPLAACDVCRLRLQHRTGAYLINASLASSAGTMPRVRVVVVNRTAQRDQAPRLIVALCAERRRRAMARDPTGSRRGARRSEDHSTRDERRVYDPSTVAALALAVSLQRFTG